MYIKGIVEIEKISGGKVTITRKENNFCVNGEDMLAKFLSKSFSNKYDDNEGATQSGYFDFIAVGTGYKTAASGANNVLVLGEKPYGVLDGQTDFYDGKTVRIHSGSNAGLERAVDTDGYNPANPNFDNLPTITLSRSLTNVVESGVQFSISPVIGEQILQGEGRPDHKGGTFLNSSSWRVPVTIKKVLSSNTEPVGESNEVYITATLDSTQLSGANSVLLTEAALVNTDVTASPGQKSGEMQARVLMTPTEKGVDDVINIRWRMRLGSQRDL